MHEETVASILSKLVEVRHGHGLHHSQAASHLRSHRPFRARRCTRHTASFLPGLSQMSLNKKQKKQIDVAKGKITKFQQLLNAARKQPDDPAEIPRLQQEIARLEAEIEKIRSAP
jgi:valyl-tRNA synthetase